MKGTRKTQGAVVLILNAPMIARNDSSVLSEVGFSSQSRSNGWSMVQIFTLIEKEAR